MTDEVKETEVIETKRTRKQEKKQHVTIIASNDSSSLVEYLTKSGEVKRCYIPVEEASGGEASPEILEAGIAYGDDLSGIVTDEVIVSLHNYGIWTKADILGDREQLQNALTAALIRPVLEKLTEFAGKQGG